jgi:hypothetical protein
MEAGTVACSACGKRIDPDDPELRRADGRRICMGCFQRTGI